MTLPDDGTGNEVGRPGFQRWSRSGPHFVVPLSPMIGRERELESVCALIRNGDSRLITLTGPGGVGKTRLALSVAAALKDDFTDGAWFFPLETVRDVDGLVPTIAAEIGVGEVSGRPLLDRLVARLRESRALLVLDNFEHIIDAAPVVVHILERCPQVQAVVTSRTVLHVLGELDVDVAPLPVADSATSDGPAAAEANPAVTLFNARSPNSNSAASAADQSVVMDICRRLDGLPLAIELAAARCNVLPPEELLERLDQRLPLLVGGARNIPDRHRTMREAINWSYGLLSADEQRIFRHLAVFYGGWTIDAATRMFEELDELQVIDAIGALVDSSLVRRSNEAGGTRFRMLETIREFALDALAASGEGHAVRQRHALATTTVAERLQEHLDRGVVTQSLLDFAVAEMPNVLGAIDFFRSTEQHRRALTLAGTIGPFWLFIGFLTEGTRLLEAVLAADEDAPAPLRARALRPLGMMYRPLRNEARGVACLEACLALERESGDTMSLALTLDFLGVVLLGLGDYDRADDVLGEALILLSGQDTGAEWVDHVLHHQGLLRLGKGERDEASRLLEQALSRHRGHGDRRGEASSQVVLALIDALEGRVERSSSRVLAALDTWEELRMSEGRAGCFAATVVLAHAAGQPREAARFYGVAEAICDTSGFRFTLPERAIYRDVYTALRARLSDDAWQDAFREGRNLPYNEAILALREFLHDIERTDPGPSELGLSPRETEVLALLATGCPDREIAEELFVSLRTVQTHVSHILKKLDVRSRAEAAAVAVRNDLA